MDFISSLRHWFFLALVLGIWPFRFLHNPIRIQKSFFFLVWSLLRMVYFIFSVYLSFLEIDTTSLAKTLISTNDALLNFLMGSISFYFFIKSESVFLLLFKLNNLSSPTKRISFYFGFVISYLSLSIVVIFVGLETKYLILGSYSPRYYLYLVNIYLIEIHFFHIAIGLMAGIYYIKLNIQHINEALTELIPLRPLVFRYQPEDIIETTKKYFHICEIADELNSLFSFISLVIFTSSFSVITIYSYHLLSNLIQIVPEAQLDIYGGWLFWSSFRIILVVYICASASKEVKSTSSFFMNPKTLID